MIPAEQAVRSLLALKLLGTERKSHVMDLVFDPAVALFAGLNVVPKRSYLAAYSSRVDHRANLRLMDAWFEQVADRRPARTARRWIWTFIPCRPTPPRSRWRSTTFPAAAGASRASWSSWRAMPNNASSAMPTPASPKPSRRMRFCVHRVLEAPHRATCPAELIFDSQLTTHENLSNLNQQGIRLHHPAPPLAEDAGGDLQPPRLGLAAASRWTR